MMNSGDLALINIDVAAAGLVLDPRTRVTIVFIPEIGTPVTHSFRTPSSYCTLLEISLYP